MADRKCKTCGKDIINRIAGAVYCGEPCRRKAYKRPVKSSFIDLPDLGHGNSGAYTELLVSLDLMSKGYYVYRNLSAHGPCDLIILNKNTGTMAKVEATSGQVSTNTGQITWPPRNNNHQFDYLAINVCGKIIYQPLLPTVAQIEVNKCPNAA